MFTSTTKGNAMTTGNNGGGDISSIECITYTDALKAHMKARNLKHIEIGTTESRTCQAGITDIVICLLTDQGAARTEARALHVLEGDMGKVLITSPDLEYDTTVEFGMRTFLGIEDPVVTGIRPKRPTLPRTPPPQHSTYHQTVSIHSRSENP